jgi:hypothetical protein
MQALVLILLLSLMLGAEAQAQRAVFKSPPDVTVVKASWKKQSRRNPLGARSHPGTSTGEDYAEMRARVKREMIDAQARNLPGGHPPPPPRTEPIRVPRRPQAEVPQEGYQYTAMVSNRSAKTIRAIEWQYVFREVGREEVPTRHKFRSRVVLAPGKVKAIKSFSHAPPMRVISAASLERDGGNTFIEEVSITRVEFSDGSAWQHK